jgi:hypothetical protein
MATRRGFDVPELIGGMSSTIRETIIAIQQLYEGKSNNTGDVTLTANSATTTLEDKRIGPNSVLSFDPLTANASAALNDGSFYVSARATTKGQATINHTNNANTDKTFSYTVTG